MSAANQNGEDLGYVDMPPANMPTEWRLSNETFSEKFMRKFKSNPLIPIGTLLFYLIAAHPRMPKWGGV